MSVRLRKWISPDGTPRDAWIADYRAPNGKRSIKTFPDERTAKRFWNNLLRARELKRRSELQDAIDRLAEIKPVKARIRL